MPKVFQMLSLLCGRLLYFKLFLSGVFFFLSPFGVYVCVNLYVRVQVCMCSLCVGGGQRTTLGVALGYLPSFI